MISAAAVLGTGFHAAMFGRNTVNVTLLPVNLVMRSLENECQNDHFIRVKAFDFGDEKLLYTALPNLHSGRSGF